MSARDREALEALRSCADEPIRVPGAVQPHGALLAVEEPDLRVVVASANAPALLGSRPERLGQLLAPASLTKLQTACADGLAEASPLRLELITGSSYDVSAHRSQDLLVTEWEPARLEPASPWYRRLPAVLDRLSAAGSLEDLAQVLVAEARRLTGFDRVMVYRFDPQWNGEVLAEDRREDLEPFLGLRYPSSDIPAQARELYARSWLRLIPDATYDPVPLVPPIDPGSGAPLDLSDVTLRSVSPVHLEYLANMGVTASMSVSLLDRGRLWGLIACHHYDGPHCPSPDDRRAAELLGRAASLLLHTKADAGAVERVAEVAARLTGLVAASGQRPREPMAALTEHPMTLLDLVPAKGAAVRLDGRWVLLGQTPPAERVPELVDAVLAAGGATSAVEQDLPQVQGLSGTAAGVLAVPAGERGALAWFRPETVREVRWAGDPRTSKTVTDTPRGPRLSPRRSFASWTETVRGTAQPWLEHEVAAARALAQHLVETALLRAEQDDRVAHALQRTLLLERVPAVPGLDLAARYVPAAHDVVGGDWYDLVVLPDGRVALVVGDTAGHGLSAAAATAQLRHALRAHLLRDEGPGAALGALNDLIAQLLPGEMATAVVLVLDPASGRGRLAGAGHLPPLRVRADGVERVQGGRGPALGLLEGVTYAEAELHLAAGESLLLYTDGLVERRGSDLDTDVRRLEQAAACPADGPEALLDGVLAALEPTSDDDVTVLGLALTGRGWT